MERGLVSRLAGHGAAGEGVASSSSFCGGDAGVETDEVVGGEDWRQEVESRLEQWVWRPKGVP